MVRLIGLHRELHRADRVDYGWRDAPVDCELEIVAGFICIRSWSPCLWTSGRRLSENFRFADFLALDFDCSLPLAEALNAFCDMQHVIGLTRNHQLPKDGEPPGDRYRVVIPFERRITSADEYRYTMYRYVTKYEADKKCKDAARFFFPCRNVVSIQLEGYEADVFEPPPPERRKAKAAAFAARGSLPPFIIRRLKVPFAQGERNDEAFKTAKYIINAGYDQGDAFDMLSPLVTADFYDELRKCISNAAKSVDGGLAFGR